jgi:LPS-assembly protein
VSADRLKSLILGARGAAAAAALGAALSFGLASGISVAAAQELQAVDGQQLLLASDSLVYDFDGDTITAAGGVQISYGDTKLVARTVTFNRKTGRLVARGNVEIIEADGNRIYADEIDVPDDFADGFVTALRLETTDNTRFAAARAERRDGNIAIFERGVYTACEPCADKPEKPVTWQVKAETIIWNQQRKTIRFEGARFELFGFPLATLPSFEIADHTVKRKSGFLTPSIGYKDDLGYSVEIPYFWAIAPNMDLLLKARGYSKQGVFLAGTFTHQLNKGKYSVTLAGISQQDPDAFLAGTEDRLNQDRGMIGTKGAFQLNRRWTLGWDLLFQTDGNFAKRYQVEGYEANKRTSQIYLTGIGDRSYFDLRGQRFEVQQDKDTGLQDQQALVLPSFDYRKVVEQPVLGGELSFRVNGRSITREKDDIDTIDADGDGVTDRNAIRGLSGANTRVSAQADWQRSFTAPGGLVLTPFAGVRADGVMTDFDASAQAALAKDALLRNVELETRDSFHRTMAQIGIDARWPVLITTPNSSHVIEPRVQLIVRPDTPDQQRFGMPNEDAQSLVFDAASLFEQDKFSGLDRIEGGTRANVGIRYSGTYANGWRADALFGQSYHLAGDNPYAAPDLVFAGAYSGLESDVSDFVASASLGYDVPEGSAGWLSAVSLGTGARFDEETFELRRAEAQLAFAGSSTRITAGYAFIQAQPYYGFNVDRHEVKGGISQKLTMNWTATGNATYNIEAAKISSFGVGLRYDDECFTYGLAFSETRNLSTDERTRTVGFKLNFRTIGDFANSFSVN